MLESSIRRLDDGRRKSLALAVIVAAQFMVVLDIAIVNVALPSIRDDLNFAPENLQWVVSAYAILFGGALLLGGRLADIFGRRRLFMIGLAIFSGASLLCGVSWSEGSLIGFRALQGLGGALFAPAALSILMTTFAEGAERNRALGIWARPPQRRRRRRAAGRSADLVPELAVGLLHQRAGRPRGDRRGAGGAAGEPRTARAPALRRVRRDLGDGRCDAAGVRDDACHAGRLVSAPTLGLLGASAALLATFVAIELRSPAPLLPMRIFRLRSLSAANAVATMVGAVAFSQFFLLTLYMQGVLGYSAVETGVGFAAVTLTIIVFSNVAQRLVTRYGVRVVLTTGLALDAAAMVLFTRLPVDGVYFWDLFPGLVVSGVGMALSFVPMTIAGLAGVRREDAGIASGLINTSRQVGGAIGLAAVTTIVASYTSASTGSGLAAVDGELVNGFQAGFLVLAGMALLGAVLSGALLGQRQAPAEIEPLTIDNRHALEEAA